MRDPPLEQLGFRLPRAEAQRVHAGLVDDGLVLGSARGVRNADPLFVLVDMLAQCLPRICVAERRTHVRSDERRLAGVGHAHAHGSAPEHHDERGAGVLRGRLGLSVPHFVAPILSLRFNIQVPA